MGLRLEVDLSFQDLVLIFGKRVIGGRPARVQLDQHLQRIFWAVFHIHF